MSRSRKGTTPTSLSDGSLNPNASASARWAADQERKSRRTANIVLIGIGAVIAVPLLMRGESMQRNVYQDHNDCVADYSETQCERTYSGGSGTSYLGGRGPWYHTDPSSSPQNDPGQGRSRTSAFAGNSTTTLRAPMTIEHGVRGGFGNTGRVRSIGS